MMNDPPQKANRRALRQRMTTAEKALWLKLKSSRLAKHKFRRQASIGKYIVDFYCAKKRLIVELDGDVHGVPSQQHYDQMRQAELESWGFQILRFTNGDVKNSMVGVLERIIEALVK